MTSREIRGRRPSIFQLGRVRDDGRTVLITGWGLGSCAGGCPCHRHPSTGHIHLAEDQAAGTLGLLSYRVGCGCCQPWTAAELAAIVRDLAALTAEGATPRPALESE